MFPKMKQLGEHMILSKILEVTSLWDHTTLYKFSYMTDSQRQTSLSCGVIYHCRHRVEGKFCQIVSLTVRTSSWKYDKLTEWTIDHFFGHPKQKKTKQKERQQSMCEYFCASVCTTRTNHCYMYMLTPLCRQPPVLYVNSSYGCMYKICRVHNRGYSYARIRPIY